ncbi:hypothetical protein EYZ11_013542 [Aspergillus tanneri]|uniref:Tc1-like transposase DDE domain-containing protein n=1 Tax=Aspergillus tanneri TaxID=1220188 RepID=A0A4S3J2U3_9EURO|nr:hypothetical protein EYZ11_013542 [Aspergillus tanneri]
MRTKHNLLCGYPFPSWKFRPCVPFWAAIWGKRRSDLIRLERDFEAKKNGYTANSYLALLEELLPSIWEPGLIFMPDNARIHSAKKVTKRLQVMVYK